MNRPVIIRGGIKDQKYFRDWKSDDYMVKNFGRTSVMVEKAKVEDRAANTPMEDMPLSEYIKGYSKPGNEWYIVQDVYPHMLKDIAMPKQLECHEMNNGFNMVVMWFSSGGTSSVLHSDEQENILSIVQGTKELLLWSPDQYKNIYALVGETADRPGIAPINQRSVDMELFPRVAEAVYQKASLQEGDMLYIPRKWFHQVESPRAAGRNLGVNYWFYTGSARNDRTNTVAPPFSIPKQPENPSLHGGWAKDITDGHPNGLYGGYKLKWPEKIECRKRFAEGDMSKVYMSDHEYVDGLRRHNAQYHGNGAPQEEDGDDDDEL